MRARLRASRASELVYARTLVYGGVRRPRHILNEFFFTYTPETVLKCINDKPVVMPAALAMVTGR